MLGSIVVRKIFCAALRMCIDGVEENEQYESEIANRHRSRLKIGRADSVQVQERLIRVSFFFFGFQIVHLAA